MVPLSNYNIWGNVYFTAFLKNLTFIFLTWTCLTYIDRSTFSKSLENKFEHDKILNINFNRLLARHVQQRKLRYSNMREKLSDHSVIEKNKNISDQISTNSQLSDKRLNYIEVYMKDYEKRYRKMKGISKLDCYCEKKLFDKIHNLREFGEMMQNKKLFKKYAIVLTSIALIPAVGLIFPILFGVDKLWKGAIDYCLDEKHKIDGSSVHTNCTKIALTHYQNILDSLGKANGLIFCFIGVIVFLLCIYLLIKIIKYNRLISGRR
ncbi:Protein of unknown function, putative [Plasmodium vivax]|nr:Protein of unknown function, putative [Plasmodium vivax]